MARKGIIQSTINAETGRLTITVQGVGQLTLNVADVAPTNRDYAALHGFKQRIVDAAAFSRDESNGASATPQEKYEAMRRLVDHYASGATEWGLRAASGGAGSEGGLTLRAVARVQGVDVATIRERVEAMAEKRGVTTRAYLARLAKQPAVVAEMNAIRLEEAADDADVDDLLEELERSEADRG